MDDSARGYTLLELLFSLSLLALLVSLGLSRVPGSQARAESKAFHSTVTRSLAMARSQAVASNERITICGTRDGVNCERNWVHSVQILVFADRDRNRRYSPGDLLHRQVLLPLNHGNAYWRGSAGRKYQRFTANGRALEFGRYTYCPLSGEGKELRQLVVNRVGRSYLHWETPGKPDICN